MFPLNDQDPSGKARHASDEPQDLTRVISQQENREPPAVDHDGDAATALPPSKEAPHPASAHDAGTGQGTLFRMPKGEVLDRPVLDGSTESSEAQRSTVNPFRGLKDPALGEWNYEYPHAHEDEVEYEPERRQVREAEEAAHADDPEPRHWYKYDPFREERNREKAEAREHELLGDKVLGDEALGEQDGEGREG